MEICKHSQNIIFAPQNIEIDTVVFLTLTNNAQQLIKTTQLHLRLVFFFICKYYLHYLVSIEITFVIT
jgi:hypothetical protein